MLSELTARWNESVFPVDGRGFFTIVHTLSEEVFLSSKNLVTREAAFELARRLNALDFANRDKSFREQARAIYLEWLKEQYPLFDFR